MKLRIGGMEFSFDAAPELSQKLEAAAKKLDEKISELENLKKQRRSILKALKEFRNNAHSEE